MPEKNTLIFCLFLLGTVLSSLSFLFFYGNSMADKRNVARNSLSYRTFTLYGDRNWTMKDLQSLWDSASGSLDVRVSHTVELPAASEYPELSVQAFLNNNAGVYFYQGQTSFTPEQLEQDCAIAPSNAGDFLNLEGTKFPVVGRTHHFSNDVVFIPIHSFLEHEFSPDSVELILDTIPTRKENNRILEQLSILFPETSIADPHQSIRTDQSRNSGGVAMISGIYLISILSFLFLFQYLIQEKQLRKCGVFSGRSKEVQRSRHRLHGAHLAQWRFRAAGGPATTPRCTSPFSCTSTSTARYPIL